MSNYNCDYVRRHYGVPAEIGRRVIANGEPGVIMADRGHYIGVILDSDPKMRIRNYHPTWEMQYEPVGEVVAFGKGLHEIAWAAGRMPRLGAKLYTHPAPADPGEVERLSQVIRDLNDERDEIGAEVGRLRAQLAERDALLRDLEGKTILSWPDKRRISAALSASAEPSAPVERDELMELLRDMTYAYRGAIQAGYDRITSLGGDCDSVDKMLADIPAYAKARAALERNPS